MRTVAATFALSIAATLVGIGCANPDTVDLEVVPLNTHVVAAGETWWTIAGDCPSTVDRRVWVEWLTAQTGVDADQTLTAGQTVKSCR